MAQTKKTNRKTTHKKNYSRSSSRKADDVIINENDVTWYTRYPSLVGPNASINFNSRYGAKLSQLSDINTPAPVNTRVMTTIPGIIVSDFLPIYADAASTASAVNVASKNLYTFVRHANSGSANYESSDLMQYIITVMNLYMHIELAKRDIRIIHTYNASNKYIGKITLDSFRPSGWSQDLLTNVATYVGKLNVIIGKLNTFKIPKDIAILDRHLWLASNIFRDDELYKYTQYIFNSKYFAHYDWANRVIEIKDRISALTTFDAYLNLINSEIDNLLDYEDIGIMLGDILKAYKVEGCRVMLPMNLGEILEPVYSTEILDQMRNMTVLGFSGAGEFTIKQLTTNSQIIYLEKDNNGYTDGRLAFTIPQLGSLHQNISAKYTPLLVVDSDNPNTDQVILNTRLAYPVEFSNNIGVTTTYGSEVVYACKAYSFMSTVAVNDDEVEFKPSFMWGHSSLVLVGYDTNNPQDLLFNLFYNWMGKNQVHKATGSPQYAMILDIEQNGNYTFCETNYYNGKNVVPVSAQWLDRLHTACKLSEWTMPMFKLLEN